MISGLCLFFIAFCASFDFKYPIYCDPKDFRLEKRLDHENKMILEESITDCPQNNTYFVNIGWTFIYIIITIIPVVFVTVMIITFIFNYVNTKTE